MLKNFADSNVTKKAELNSFTIFVREMYSTSLLSVILNKSPIIGVFCGEFARCAGNSNIVVKTRKKTISYES